MTSRTAGHHPHSTASSTIGPEPPRATCNRSARSVQLFTPEATAYGPYVGSAPARWNPYVAPLFTRATAERIVQDLHRDTCGLTAAWDGSLLRFDWTADYDGTGGSETLTPDQHHRYAIGGRWPWQDWDEDIPQTAGQAAYARGVAEAGLPEPTPMPDGLAELYADGRAEALRLAPAPARRTDTAANAA
ncbi:hypothetical protein ACH41H_24215 [Streptomyces sp. NPDC020800]|uniref:hypothetical protein n=1 Tax=Streptomyces sp. NPDC020800 TaxID=3365092 RepID=UPI00378A8C0D